MQHTSHASKIVRCGVFEIDLKAFELRKHGLRLKLAEQPFQILAILLEQPGEVVTRDELRERLWPGDTFVDFDHGLNNAVMRLREALGDSHDKPRFIETLPRRGYRFIAPIEEIHPGSRINFDGDPQTNSSAALHASDGPAQLSADPNQLVSRRNAGNWLTLPRIALMSAAVLVFAVLSGLAVHFVRGWESGKINPAHNMSLVVLPLENLSGDAEQDYFADGMTDELTANLAKIRSLRVISRSTAMAYKGTHKPLSEIAKDLKVDAVVEGTVLKAGNRVRITAELVQVSTDHHLWADTYESQIGDVLALQNRVSSAIVDEIRINLSPEDKQRLAKNPSVSPDAYEDYLKGRYYWNRRSSDGFTKAIGYFEDATRRDPQYALAYAGLADCYGIIGATIYGSLPAAEAAPKAKAAAIRALEIDPSLAEAETSLATAKFNYDWDWAGAAQGFQRAIQMDPRYATAYQRYSLYSIAMGRRDESLEQIKRARELDPLSISINSSLGWRLYLARQYDRSIAQLRDTLELDPSYEWAHFILGQAYEQKREFDLARAELQKAVELSHNSPLMISALAHAEALSGNQEEALRLLQHLMTQSKKQYVSPFYVGVVYIALGKTETAMDWMEKAFADRSNGLVFLKVEPELDPLRSNARFIALQKQLNFPD
ncbi:MAG TPA: winged helix-turn-helix domain-containing protein [Candidatus Acidoferrum sp.]|nr:winged helix-turn-helix domain-containing protein [Candidatus Acidoferrum sp.]